MGLHSSPRSVDLLTIQGANEPERKMPQNEVYVNKIWPEFWDIWQPWHQDRWFQKTYLDTIILRLNCGVTFHIETGPFAAIVQPGFLALSDI